MSLVNRLPKPDNFLMNYNSTVPQFDIEHRTLVFDEVNQQQIMWINGILPLQKDARIRITDVGGQTGTWDAVVQSVGTIATGAKGAQADENGVVTLMLNVVLEQPA